MNQRAVCTNRTPTAEAYLQKRETVSSEIRARMIALQEELDWEAIGCTGLIEDDLTYTGDDLPELALGERAFEIALARAVKQARRRRPGLPGMDRRRSRRFRSTGQPLIGSLCSGGLISLRANPSIRLLERPEYKRRWAQEPWEKRQERALREWLLDRVEDRRFWFDAQGRPLPRSVAQLGR